MPKNIGIVSFTDGSNKSGIIIIIIIIIIIDLYSAISRAHGALNVEMKVQITTKKLDNCPTAIHSISMMA